MIRSGSDGLVPDSDDEHDHEQEHSDDEEEDTGFRAQPGRIDPRAVLSVDANAVFLVLIINFLDSLGGSISTPILPFYAKEFHASYGQIGELFSAFAFAQMASMPFLSFCSDKYGRRNVLLLATLGSAVGSMWQGAASSYNSLLVSRVFSGFWSGVASVCQVYLVDVVPPDLRADYMSYLNSSTQASVLFGPSIGAGLSYLGLTAPLHVQGAVNLLLFFIVWAHLPESPEWCRAHCPTSPHSPFSSSSASRTKRSDTLRQVGLGRRMTLGVVLAFGVLSFCGMVSQMSIMSMFAVYAEQTYELDSVHVGFTMTLGALSSVGTNIWISPPILHSVGENIASLIGFVLIFVGSAMISLQPLGLSVVGFMLAYQGLAINSSAVATGAANMTDPTNRATIMTGSRMLKSLGAVLGPIVSGRLASADVRLPFIAAAAFALGGFCSQVVTYPLLQHVKELLSKRRTVGSSTPFLEGQWVDEQGTRDEIWDLGLYVATLLTTRHYRWITYNNELKNFISDCFPPISTDSLEAHRRTYDSRRKLVRSGMDMTYEELLKQFQELSRENREMRKLLDEATASRRRSKSNPRERSSWDAQEVAEQYSKNINYQMMKPGMGGFGGAL